MSAPRASPNLLALAAFLYGAAVVEHRAVNEAADAAARALGDAWTPLVAACGVAVLGAVLGIVGRRAPRREPILIGLSLGLGVIVLFQVPIEWVHYVQYAGLVALLDRGLGGRAPRGVLLGLGIGLGALDEAVQWRILYRDRPDLEFDVPDVALDALGALLGLAVARWTRNPRASRAPDPCRADDLR